MTKAPIIEVQNVKRSFRSVKKKEGLRGAIDLLIKPEYTSHEALKGVSFQIEEGSFVGLIGANGAGKTTLLKILSGLIPPSSGHARVLGVEPFTRPIHFRKQIALLMGQKAQLWWDLPALDAFDLLRAIYDIPAATYRERLEELSTLLDVKKHLHTQIRRLSLGERMKMELIGSLLHWPKVIFLDEPTIGLDVLAAHKLREFLRVFNQKEKATIILTSHNMDDIERLCSRVLIIREGELIYDGKPTGLTQEGEKRLKLHFMEKVTPEELHKITQLPEGSIQIGVASEDDEDSDSEAQERTAVFNLQHNQIVPTLQALMARLTLTDMGIEQQSLERVIQRIYSEDKKDLRP